MSQVIDSLQISPSKGHKLLRIPRLVTSTESTTSEEATGHRGQDKLLKYRTSIDSNEIPKREEEGEVKGFDETPTA